MGYSPWGCKELDTTERLNYGDRLNGGASLVAQTVNNLPAIQETWVRSMGGEDPWRRKGYLLQDSCLENFIDRGVWRATVHGFAKSWTQLSKLHFYET